MQRALVWLKHDLRLNDHAPLAAAAGFKEALAVYAIEPAWTSSPEFDPQHLGFALACLAPLARQLQARGLPLQVLQGSLPGLLSELHSAWPFTHLLSHEETGTGWSYQRDTEVAAWCRAHGVQWQEWPQTGVVRRLKSRSGWAGRWTQRMQAPQVPAPAAFRGAALGQPAWPKPPASRPLPKAGEAGAWETLNSFLEERGRRYRSQLSSPLTAEQGCSRLSAHLSFGTLSMRQVHQATEAHIQSLREQDPRHAQNLRGFASRLRWHCHFMQKLESEPAIEFRNFSRSVDGLRPGDGRPMSTLDEARLQAWMEGRTGFPMVDACMRSLNATGWLNFRMRAMLVSFAAYHLGLHWRLPGLHLARQFLDFEPGIHWSQMQMQSGCTGINTLRIYSPRKQALDHDPDGRFQRRWLPELGTPDYPAPIVNERAQLAAIKEQLYGLRRLPEARQEAAAIQAQHGSRKSGLPPSSRRSQAQPPKLAAQLQKDLFD
jgi:deoxyribodipyrimidine photo-lyase